MMNRITVIYFLALTATLLLLFSYSSACVQVVDFEAENGEPLRDECTSLNEPPCIKYRGWASGRLSIYLKKPEQSVSHTFTTVSKCLFQVLNVYYSNDGLRDKLMVMLDNEEIGKFHTRSRSAVGQLWDKYLTSGNVGNEKEISPGSHTLKVSVLSTDKYGVELDKFEVLFRCESDVCPTASMQSTDPLEFLLYNLARSKKTT